MVLREKGEEGRRGEIRSKGWRWEFETNPLPRDPTPGTGSHSDGSEASGPMA